MSGAGARSTVSRDAAADSAPGRAAGSFSWRVGVRPFDCNVMLGPTNTERVPSFRTAEALLAEMDRVGIAEALVYASQARMAQHPVEPSTLHPSKLDSGRIRHKEPICTRTPWGVLVQIGGRMS